MNDRKGMKMVFRHFRTKHGLCYYSKKRESYTCEKKRRYLSLASSVSVCLSRSAVWEPLVPYFYERLRGM